jgi:hypothetical protein
MTNFLSISRLLAGCGLCLPLSERVKDTLTTPKMNGLDPALCRALLQEEEECVDGCIGAPPSSSSTTAGDGEQGQATSEKSVLFNSALNHCSHQDEDVNDVGLLPFRGVPKQPLYLEVSRRLEILNQLATATRRHPNIYQPSISGANPISSSSPDLLLPASALKFSEMDRPPLPTNTTNIRDWFQKAGNDGILHLLGIRKTVGTPSQRWLLPPSWNQLMESANQIHKAKLTVAACARAKHAHRGGVNSFFGVAKGNPKHQNEVAAELVLQLLREAIWINIHTFGGMNQHEPVLEIRVTSGYGARWTADWFNFEEGSVGDDGPVPSPKTRIIPQNVVFRGFLEPQMENGYEFKWRHA